MAKKILSLILLVLFLVPMVTASYGYGQQFGQDQFYYVVFDSEGEASVVLRLELPANADVDSLKLEIPGESMRIIAVQQEYYTYNERGYRNYPVKYVDVNYTYELLKDSVSLDLDIPRPKEENIVLFLFYKTEDYIVQKGGVYHYNFQTVTNKFDTNTVRVSLDVAEDLYLKGIDASIDYRDNKGYNTMALGEVATADMAVAMSSSIRSVQTGYSKTASGLDPHESYTVTGKYADSWWTINWWKPFLGVVVLLSVLGAGAYGLTRLYQKKKKLGASVSVGMGSGVLVAGSWLGVLFLLDVVSFGYNSVIPVFLVLLTIMMSGFIFFAPSVMIGYTKGVKYGIYCFVATTLTTFGLALLGLIVYVLLGTMASSPIPIYY